MTLSLRERRRRETAREIQIATLKLATVHGLDQITTDAIAKAAGISTRTFFNYYANKEAAAVGTPPGFKDDAKDALRHGTAPLAVDLKHLLDSHIASLAESIETLRMVRKIVYTNPNARGVLDRFLTAECEDLAMCLSDRVAEPGIARALAETAVRCVGRAIVLWENDQGLTLAEALDTAWADQIAASRILAGAGP